MPTPMTATPMEFLVMSGFLASRVVMGSGVEGGFAAELDLDALAAVEGRHAGVADHLGGVPVPGARAGQRDAARDLVDPLLELHVVRRDEPLAPVLGDGDADAASAAQDYLTGVRQCGGSGLADDLAPDVVAVADVHRGLDV